MVVMKTLKIALEKLGYRVYHIAECVPRWKGKHLHLFEEATRAKLLGQGKLWTGAELDKVLQDYTASSLKAAKTSCESTFYPKLLRISRVSTL